MTAPVHVHATVVYFVPKDRTPLADWRDRVTYLCGRIVAFHERELQGQSRLVTAIHPEPVVSIHATPQLRLGDATFTFLLTLAEVEQRVPQRPAAGAFPSLVVLSDINWGEVDDFYRLHGDRFEGTVVAGRHVPGTPLGGSRATRAGDRGLALVSADGWRVPYAGSDCVVYHEAVGHPLGLAHPPRPDGSVMSQGQYRGWLNASWLAGADKRRLGWVAAPDPRPRERDLFTAFAASPEPAVPAPGQPVHLHVRWPRDAEIAHCRVGWQTGLGEPWADRVVDGSRPVPLGPFPHPTPVSYRVRGALADGQEVELWGYLQVRARPDEPPRPPYPLVATVRPPAIELAETIHHGAYGVAAVVTPVAAPVAVAIGLPLGGRRATVVLPDARFAPGRPTAIACVAREGVLRVSWEGEELVVTAPTDDGPPFLDARGCRLESLAVSAG